VPYFSSTIFVAALIGALLIAQAAYFLFAQALFPRFVARAERAWSERPVSTVAIGLPVAATLAIVAVALLNAPKPPIRIAGFVFAGVALGLAFAGTAGLAARIGRGLSAPGDAGREWARLRRGGIVLELAMLFPILGWFVIAPIAIVGGAGAAAAALFRRDARATLPAMATPAMAAPSGAIVSSIEKPS
jgi:hypothetical protein